MQRFLRSPVVAIMATLVLASACNSSPSDNEQDSTTKSDWETELTEGGLRTYAIDWACEPKQFGASAETKFANQDEYCEWKVEKTTASEKICRFTTSFDRSRDFHLNSRGKTPQNSIEAARQLVEDCNGIALRRLKSGQSAGKLCSGIENGCVSGRNSDPEICDKVRWAVGEKYKGNIEFCVDNLAPWGYPTPKKPLMQFGVLADIPENCEFADEEQTELRCTVAPEDSCFSIAGQIRVGIHVQTKSKAAPATEFEETDDIFNEDESTNGSGLEPAAPAELPSAKACYVP